MKYLIQFIRITIILSATFSFLSPNVLFNDANDFYQQGRLDEALHLYLKLYDEGDNNLSILYNLGTSALKKYQISQSPENLAFAQYYLSLAFAKEPLDKDVYHNLKLVNQIIGEEPPHPFLTWINNSDIWKLFLHIVILCFSLHLLYIVHRRLSFDKKNIIRLVIYFVLLITGVLLYLLRDTPLKQSLGVIKNHDGYIYSEPVHSSTRLASLPNGYRLDVIQKNEEWLKVQLDSNRVGWIEEKNCLFHGELD